MNDQYTIFDIADWFLSKESMTHKKLQKLCFYAKAWHLVLFNKTNITSEEFQAWVHGPVSPTLYQKYKVFGWTPIDKIDSSSITNPIIDDFLQKIWDTYGELDGHQLESLTHKESPWISARAGLNTWDSSTRVISEDSMHNYYSSIYQGE